MSESEFQMEQVAEQLKTFGLELDNRLAALLVELGARHETLTTGEGGVAVSIVLIRQAMQILMQVSDDPREWVAGQVDIIYKRARGEDVSDKDFILVVAEPDEDVKRAQN